MANPLKDQISQLQANFDRLSRHTQRLFSEKTALELENDALNEEVRRLWDENKRLKSDVEFLQVSYRLAENPDSLQDTRRLIADMIRDIEKSIQMLKE